MATAAQFAANRANAQHSTGPASAQGKARSARNNLRHGLRSESVLLPGDDPAEFDALLEDLLQHFCPRGLSAGRFVREMADAEWRLRRARACQRELLTAKIDELAPLHPGAAPVRLQALAFQALHAETCFAQFLRYEVKFERQYDRAYNGWLATQAKISQHEYRQQRAELEALMNEPLPWQSMAEPLDEEELPEEELEPEELEELREEDAAEDELREEELPRKELPDEPNFVPRNAPCPCGSGLKFKRCCGRHAPAVLGPRPKAA